MQKFNTSALKTYGIVNIRFSTYDKLSKMRFFKEIFLLAHISMKVVLKMLFLALSNAKIEFDIKNFM